LGAASGARFDATARAASNAATNRVKRNRFLLIIFFRRDIARNVFLPPTARRSKLRFDGCNLSVFGSSALLPWPGLRPECPASERLRVAPAVALESLPDLCPP